MIARSKLAISALGLALPLAVGLVLQSPADAREIAPTLMSEPCVTTARDDVAAIPGLPQDEGLVCGGRLIGQISTTPLLARSGTPIEQIIETSYRNSRAAILHRGELRCSQGFKPLGEFAPGTWALACRRNNGGWQHLVVVAPDEGLVRIADGPPSALPSMLSAIAVASQVTTGTSNTGPMLEAIFGERVPLASADDLEGFKSMVREARAANGLSRYDEAERLFRRALALQIRLLSENDPSIAETLMDLALNVSNQGRDEEALALFRRAEPVIQRSPRAADRARFSAYRGYHEANFRRHEQALSFARAAVAGWREQVSGPRVNLGPSAAEDSAVSLDRGELALALNLLAAMALRVDELALALASASEALQILNENDGLPRWWRSDVLLTLGRISSAQGRLSAAETYLNNSLAEQRQIAGDGPHTLPTRLALAKAYQAEGLDTAALITYREIFTLVRKFGPGGGARLTIEDVIPFGLAATRYAAQLRDESQRQGLFSEAFDAFQLVRPDAVDQTLLRARERLPAAQPALADLLERIREAERQRASAMLALSFETALPDAQRSRIAEERLAQEADQAARRLDSLNASLAAQHPDYRRLSAAPMIDLLDLRRRLTVNEALISLIVGERATLVQLIRREGVQIRVIASGERVLGEAVSSLRRSFDVGTSGLGAFDEAGAHRLYRLLFEPLADHLDGIEHLVVIPTGPLASLPFALLITEPPEAGSSSPPAWLIQRTALSHLPSLQAFASLRGNAPTARAPEAMLAFADPVLSGLPPRPLTGDDRPRPDAARVLADRCRQDGPAEAELLRALAPLPDSGDEVRAVAASLGKGGLKTTVLTREAANESALRKLPLERYRVLYFATHGLLPGELRCQSEPGLILTPPERAGSREEDGLLEASEIAALKLNAEMVVLSACNTAGFNDRPGGDSLSGLAEAFFHAGARSILASHWQVSSSATTRLMTDLFERLGPDVSLGSAQALRDAQLALSAQQSTSHPFFWAAFTLIGDGQDSRRQPIREASPVSGSQTLREGALS